MIMGQWWKFFLLLGVTLALYFIGVIVGNHLHFDNDLGNTALGSCLAIGIAAIIIGTFNDEFTAGNCLLFVFAAILLILIISGAASIVYWMYITESLILLFLVYRIKVRVTLNTTFI